MTDVPYVDNFFAVNALYGLNQHGVGLLGFSILMVLPAKNVHTVVSNGGGYLGCRFG